MVSIYLFIDWKRVFITYFRIRSATANLEFFWCVFSRMRTEYWLNLRIQSESEKKRTRKTTNTDIYHVQDNIILKLYWVKSSIYRSGFDDVNISIFDVTKKSETQFRSWFV